MARVILLTFFLTTLNHFSFCQGGIVGGVELVNSIVVSGPKNSVQGNIETYSVTYYNSNNQIVDSPTGISTWSVVGGEILNNSQNTVNVLWNTFGGRQIVSLQFTTSYGSFFDNESVSITAPTPVTPNTAFTFVFNCNETVVNRVSNPPIGITWFWQTSSTGTITSLGSSNSIPRQTGGSLFLRARNEANVWSTSSQSVGTITIVTPPSVPSSSTNGNIISATGGVVPLSVSAVSEATSYRWYTTATGGTVIAGVNTNTYSPNVTTTTTYHVESVNGNCPSTSRRAVTAIVHPVPVIIGPDNIAMNQPITLSVSNQYDSYQWRLNNVDIAGATQATYQTNVAGIYTVRVNKGNSPPFVSASKHIVNGPFSQNITFVVSNSILVKGITDALIIDQLPAEKNSQTIQYFDGLGRPIQNVTTQGSPSKSDIVQPVVYDGLGREAVKYLPYVQGDNGLFKNDFKEQNHPQYASSPQALFYNQASNLVASSAHPFSETLFEPSPLNRVLKQGAPGTIWQPNTSNYENKTDRAIGFVYEFNGQDEVLLWEYLYAAAGATFGQIDAAKYSPSLAIQYYNKNELYKNRTKDENNREVIEYKDKEGRVILKRVQVADNVTAVNDELYASTYYIYDDFGNLVAVVPPEATKIISANPTAFFTQTVANKEAFFNRWAFLYRYDGRKRMVAKKVPGADPVFMVYDKRDRLVATQDGNQRTVKQWTFTKYDALNRPVLTGIIANEVDTTRLMMQAKVDNFYNALTATTAWFETYVGNVAGNVHGYNNYSFPQETDVSKYLTVTYYDNYQFKSLLGTTYNYVNDNLSATVHGATYMQPAQEWLRVIGQVTGTKVKILNGADNTGTLWLNTVNYYDEDYRLIQSISDNYKSVLVANRSGSDRISTLYDFTGKVLRTLSTHPLGWTRATGVQLTATSITKTAPTGSWVNAGVSSIATLAVGQNGFVEFTASETNTSRMLGLNDVDTDLNFTNINYAINVNASGRIFVYENNTSRGDRGPYVAGDVLRIERVGTTILYKKNGTTFYTSTVPSTTSLKIDATLHSPNATITGIRSSFGQMVVARRFDYDHAGRLINTWHKLNNQPEILLVNNTYNELGQLIDKKLHSTVAAATDAKQSVDYRYNIRGWLTTINGANIKSPTNPNNDDNTDFFGMELLYENTSADLGNSAQFNGNISATKWSSNLGFGTKNQLGYSYQYDPLNRLLSSSYKEATAGVWSTPTNNKFSETGFSYDLNGNIRALTRNDARTGTVMDQLTYSYTDGGFQQSNMLRSVTDAGDKNTGFKDGQFAVNVADYTYDANGNMLRDLNKGISTNIEYNFLNLPRLVTKSGSSIRYIYDATGRKLSQVVTSNSNTKQTDYLSEFVYEQDALQFLNHEEGRIVVSNEKDIYTYDGSHLTGITATASATLTQQTINGQSYLIVNVGSTGLTSRGVSSLGGSRPVVAGQRYRVRVKGYTPTSEQVRLLIQFNGATQPSLNAIFQQGAHNEAWVESIFTITPSTTTLNLGVAWVSGTGPRTFYINEAEITLLEEKEPEYQYHLKDHLGNTRVTFTSKQEAESIKATMEDANAATEQAQFIYYNEAVKINSTLFDHTNAGTTQYATRLAGTPNERYGLAKSLQVMSGDTIRAEVFAKYLDPTTSNWTTALSNLMSSIAAGTAPPGTLIDMGSGGSTGGAIPPNLTVLGKNNETGNAPKAYLNFIVYDKDFSNPPIDQGYVRMTEAGREYGQDGLHEQLALTIPINQPGYVYIYLSNEEPGKEVYFDDFTVTHKKSPVIQMEDYYPFGLTFNSYSIENSTPNNYLYNGKEKQDELGLDWMDYGARMYMPEIGKWGVIDFLTDLDNSWSSYNYVRNNPISKVDPDGNYWADSQSEEKANQLLDNTIKKVIDVTGDLDALRDKDTSGMSEKDLKKHNRQIKSLENRAEQLTQSIGDIMSLGTDLENGYSLKSGDNQGGGKHGVSKGSDGIINIFGSNDGLYIHEIRHASNSLKSRNGFVWTKNNELSPALLGRNGSDEEISGYRAQWGYDGYGIGSEQDDFKLIKKIAELESNNVPIYDHIAKYWKAVRPAMEEQWKNERNNEN
jgi:RHS repeat-associated protein